MTAINAWTFDGSSGARAHLTLPIGRTLRTDLGTPKTLFFAFYLNSLTPGEDGYLYHCRRASNNGENWGAQFRDSADALRPMYNASSAGSASGTVAATTWMLGVSTHSGTGNDWLTRIISCPGGTLLTSFTGTGSSLFDDGQEQNLSFGARFNGTSTSEHHRGRMCLMGGINGAALSEAESLALAVDPLNEIDALLATHGSNMWVFDDTSTDISTNGFALTLAGTVALGSGNGPNIPDRETSTVVGPSINFVSNGNQNTAIIFDTVFVGEIFTEIYGAGFGATQGAGGVYFNSSNDLNGNEVEYTGTLEWSDTLIRLVGNIDIGSFQPGAIRLIVRNNDLLTGSLQIQVKSHASDAVGVRGQPPPQQLLSGQAFSFDASKIFFRQDCQQNAVFTAVSLPPGLSCSAAGVISGTVSHSANASYTSEVTLTDPLGAAASDQFTWTVQTPNPENPEEPGPDGVVAGVVGKIAIKDTSRSIGIA